MTKAIERPEVTIEEIGRRLGKQNGDTLGEKLSLYLEKVLERDLKIL